jgi:hypothetical protein
MTICYVSTYPSQDSPDYNVADQVSKQQGDLGDREIVVQRGREAGDTREGKYTLVNRQLLTPHRTRL